MANIATVSLAASLLSSSRSHRLKEPEPTSQHRPGNVPTAAMAARSSQTPAVGRTPGVRGPKEALKRIAAAVRLL